MNSIEELEIDFLPTGVLTGVPNLNKIFDALNWIIPRGINLSFQKNIY